MHVNTAWSQRQHLSFLGKLLLVTFIIAGCSEPEPPAPNIVTPPPAETTEADTQSAENLQALATALVVAVSATSQALSEKAHHFAKNPTNESLAELKSAWGSAHRDLTRANILFALADTSPALFGALESHRFNLDAEPIQPGFIDRFGVYEQSGIVNDISLPLNATHLREQHGLTDKSDIALGIHALEFLIWGDTPRTLDDFVKRSLPKEMEASGLRVVDLPENRRREYIRLSAQMLADDASALEAAWQAVLRLQLEQLQPLARLQIWHGAGQTYWNQYVLQPWISATGEYPPLVASDLPEQVAIATALTSDTTSTSQLPEEFKQNRFANLGADLFAQQLSVLKSTYLDSGLGKAVLTPDSLLQLNSSMDKANQMVKQLRERQKDQPHPQDWPWRDEALNKRLVSLCQDIHIALQDMPPLPHQGGGAY
ncbi:imelysin family protein [Marinibactrum halimedae]|uniref:Imelysin-like domain-containing protein n=1 Tax=Marinibactrum halimedae TaxID=1444977 RepID=A0AA37WL01_9GAMM|nr:imelysin family protein [Marinibactrum halimedae]MCD9458765.1 hypothetical protein [Marinibactrum halimedae]GLS25324.1 hypothetical protein GCM10007877_10380 [Marinibactrum halimedae]